jgi:hypothetical protein
MAAGFLRIVPHGGAVLFQDVCGPCRDRPSGHQPPRRARGGSPVRRYRLVVSATEDDGQRSLRPFTAPLHVPKVDFGPKKRKARRMAGLPLANNCQVMRFSRQPVRSGCT